MDMNQAIARLRDLQADIRAAIVAARDAAGMHEVSHATSADTIYRIDAEVDPILEAHCRHWAKSAPLLLIAEGIENEAGQEGFRVFPEGTREADAAIRVIMDPIDGTRGIMYDKRPAWSLAGVAPNRGHATRLRDIEAAVMTELPTSKMGHADVLWAVKGQGAHAQRVELSSLATRPLPLAPSRSGCIDHGFASVSNFFPGTKVLASELMEHIVAALIGPADVTRATVFDDQYICTGGQFYELIAGHDRFNADLRPLFYRLQGQPEGMCCHPYDCATLLIAEEAGAVITDGFGHPLDGPLDVTTGIHWCGYANAALAGQIGPLVRDFLARRGIVAD